MLTRENLFVQSKKKKKANYGFSILNSPKINKRNSPFSDIIVLYNQ